MNSYELSRVWFNFCFDNPEKINPNHSAIYFFAVEHCNRLGWKDKFGFPSQMAMEAVGIKNWRTYSKALTELVDFGFIIMVETSKNQYSSNIISLKSAYVKNTKAPTKALDKALQKHSTKQGQSTVSIDKQVTSNKEQETIDQFNSFWNLYDKKITKDKAYNLFKKLSQNDIDSLMAYIPKYKTAQPDKKFRKNPDTFLRNKSWNDEIIGDNKPDKPELPPNYHMFLSNWD